VNDAVEWSDVLDKIRSWSTEDIEKEVGNLIHNNSGIVKNFHYTFLKALSTIGKSRGKNNFRVRKNFSDHISLELFYKDFVCRLINNADIKRKEILMTLRPGDRDILAKDAFRHTLYTMVENVLPLIIETPNPVRSEMSRQSIQPSTYSDVQPNDSVSIAPSEHISEQPSNGLNESLLELHEKTVNNIEDAPSLVPSVKQSNVAKDISSDFKSRVSDHPSKQEVIIDCPTSLASRQSKRKFSRSPRSKSTSSRSHAPSFYESNRAEVNDIDTQFIR